uniref:Histidine triad (HIT) family protein n=1 Tax=Candidatus Kentrum sp. SD TaxID=2126332 RepID=A0A450YPJ4_9GAMM|nr:MAG: histidine triad (HIT) family protein [Candidatus Kentron sp. SD]VFK43467.1 MAG: histidine triad (HIT) family protein [Candidatus Kentron sp. SD]VFK80637.1 MAG: histidine triad (HIT) family protein [Candidatus Kentron sp. SD]
MIYDCVFCREIDGSRNTNFAVRYPEIKSRFIYETDSLLAFPCIGQLTKGHFLIVPRIHYCTFKHVYSNLMSLPQELDELINGVHEKLGIQIKDSLFFEHGALSQLNGGCGIYHAHLHVVPNAGVIRPNDIFDFEDREPHHHIESSWQSLSDEYSYALVGSIEDGFYFCPISVPLPSQTIRKNVAHALGLLEWDWRKTMREENLILTLEEAF